MVDIVRFYQLLESLKHKTVGFGYLAIAKGGMKWPRRGVYFFFDPGEVRTNSGAGYKVVRVGTHALNIRAKATLWDRLKAHKGTDCSGPIKLDTFYALLRGIHDRLYREYR